MANIGTTFTKSGKKAVLCGSGELGKEVALELQRYGVEVIALDKYANAPAMHVAHRSHVLSMLDGDALESVIREEKPDFIILDPPRDGIHPKALPKIINYGVERIVYISCKATSLARDLHVFMDNGYRMEKAVAVDLFPGTYHTETVCLLSGPRGRG